MPGNETGAVAAIVNSSAGSAPTTLDILTKGPQAIILGAGIDVADFNVPIDGKATGTTSISVNGKTYSATGDIYYGGGGTNTLSLPLPPQLI